MVASQYPRAKASIDTAIDQYDSLVEGKIAKLREARADLREKASAAGLKVVPWDKDKGFDQETALDPLDGRDDADRLIECNLKVVVSNEEEAVAATRLCKEQNLMQISVGAKTSALGQFEAFKVAERNGFSGVMAVQMQVFSYGSEERLNLDGETPLEPQTEDAQKLPIPEFDPSQFTLIRHPKLPIAVLKSKDFPDNPAFPHRVIAHAGFIEGSAIKFLQDHLPAQSSDGKKYQYRLAAVPTSVNDAQLGGVISTGAEGGNRTKASDDIYGLHIIDGNGEKQILSRDESKKIVSLCGNAGTVMYAEFEVTAYPPNDHGVFVPIQGNGVEAWENMLKLQAKLEQFSQTSSGNNRIQVGSGPSRLIVTGMEPLSRRALEISTKKSEDPFVKGIPTLLNEDEEYGVYITFSSDFDSNGPAAVAAFVEETFAKEGLGIDVEHVDAVMTEDGVVSSHDQATHKRVKWLSGVKRDPSGRGNPLPSELEKMDKIRHGAPEHSRAEAKKVGDVTQSTDLNIRFTSKDPNENTAARERVAAIYSRYVEAFKEDPGFDVPVYGHLYGGAGEGGGIDPHIRVIFMLNDPDSRYSAPEQVIRMKKLQRNLYRELLALDGQGGIEIHCPEKSRFTNPEYWEWFCLTHPDEAREHLRTIQKYGYSRDAEGNPDRPILGARVPHTLPGFIDKVPGGIRSLLNEKLIEKNDEDQAWVEGVHPLVRKAMAAITEISQLSHRSGGLAIQQLFGEVNRSIHESFHLTENEYSFFLEEKGEAEAVIARNFGDDYEAQGFRVQHVAVSKPEDFDRTQYPEDGKTFYVLDVKGMGVTEGVSLLISPHESIVEAYKRTVNGTNKAAHRNIYTMWSKWPQETEETPTIRAVAALGIVLQAEAFPNQVGVDREEFSSVNPGPAEIHEAIRNGSGELFERLQTLSGPEEQHRTMELLSDYLGIPEGSKLAFFASATQAMQVLADALKGKEDQINTIQITNDAFSERWYEVNKATTGAVSQITTPWATSEASELSRVTQDLLDKMVEGKRNVICVTPHKTSTTASFHPDILIEALARAGKEIGRDYDLICDITSGVGAIDYATGIDAQGKKRMKFTGSFGSLQKGGQQPPGLSYLNLSPELAKILGDGDPDKFTLAKKLKEAEEGHIASPMALAMLRQKLEADIEAGRTPEAIQRETREKVELVMAWAQDHQDILPLIPDGLDRSPILLGFISQSKNLVIAKKIMAEMGYFLGSGYGAPYEKEAIRMYLPNISMEKLKELLTAFEHVLQLDDVKNTRGENVPNVAIREPHNPLALIERLSREFQVKDIFEERPGLDWLKGLALTYNGSPEAGTDQKIVNGGFGAISPQLQQKIDMYTGERNLGLIAEILALNSPDGSNILTHYNAYLDLEKEIRTLIKWKAAGFSVLDDAGESDLDITVQVKLDACKQHLAKIAGLLGQYAESHQREDGRVSYPYQAASSTKKAA